MTGAISSPAAVVQPGPDNSEGYYARRTGLKQYELKDHLGNVRATVSDQKTAEEQDGSLYNTAKMLTYSNYYPFGMLQPGKNYSSAEYRFGFNSKEMDNDWYGSTGTIYDYGFRIYDPRIAKFLSVDPLTKDYPWYTPYQFAGNKPIMAVDLDGLEEKVVIRDYTENHDNPKVRKIDYRLTKQQNGPLGKGNMTIRKYKHNIQISYIGSPDKTFFVDLKPENYVNPPEKINDGPSFKFESKVKLGLYYETGLSVKGLKIKAEGGAFQEFYKSKWSERGCESTDAVGDLKGYLGLGPFKFESNTSKNEVSFETSTPLLKNKFTFDGNKGKFKNSSTFSGEEDVDIFNFKLGIGLGAEFDLKKTNPLKRKETKRWHKFLNDLKNNKQNND